LMWPWMGDGMGMGWGMWIWFFIFMGCAWLFLNWWSRPYRYGFYRQYDENALDVARMRLAKGELSLEEFEEIKKISRIVNQCERGW